MGEAAEKLDDLFQSAADASAAVMVAREDAHADVVRAVRAIEARLVEVLVGDVLRGTAHLVPRQFSPTLRGARVHGQPPHGIDQGLPRDGREVLVIADDGHLVMARWCVSNVAMWTTRPVRDDELRSQDLEPLVRAVQTALERHVSRAERTAASYERARDFSRRLAGAVGFEF